MTLGARPLHYANLWQFRKYDNIFMESRRHFIKRMLLAGGLLTLRWNGIAAGTLRKTTVEEAQQLVYRGINGTPGENLLRVIDLMGGIEKVIGFADVVVVKPNVQWWNQGASNLAALSALVDLIMKRPGGFKGEVILAENCHRGSSPWRSEGWARSFDRNGDLLGISTMSGLASALKNRYGSRFSLRHWIDVGAGGKRVSGPWDGEGYVFCDGSRGAPLITCENGVEGPNRRVTIMTYPISRSDTGKMIDFKNGIWERGSYTGQPLRVVMFSALNYHSTYCGLTSTIKNYLGVTDLTGGPDPNAGGCLTGNYYNFHSFPFDKWAPGPKRGMLGKEVGIFMNTIRRADLNITTAEWVGLSSRTDPPVAQTRAVLASIDPVALDYHAAKYVLYPNSRLFIHSPDEPKSPVRHYLKECCDAGGGVLDESLVKVISYDFAKRGLQEDDELVVLGQKHWGTNARALLKYFVLRLGIP
jgi:hypothetical protein